MQEEFCRVSGAQVELPLEWGEAGFRTVSDVVRTSCVDVPDIPEPVLQNWEASARRYDDFEPGTVTALASLTQSGNPRCPSGQLAAVPAFEHVARQIIAFGDTLGAGDVFRRAEPVLLAINGGAKFHHDGDSYQKSMFCVVWLEDKVGLELVFPHIGQRIALERGTTVLFDAGQPHGVLAEGQIIWSDELSLFKSRRSTQFFLSFDLEVVDSGLASVMGFEVHDAPEHCQRWGDTARLKGRYRGDVCLETGAWF